MLSFTVLMLCTLDLGANNAIKRSLGFLVFSLQANNENFKIQICISNSSYLLENTNQNYSRLTENENSPT